MTRTKRRTTEDFPTAASPKRTTEVSEQQEQYNGVAAVYEDD
jgi:hypothetical protein